MLAYTHTYIYALGHTGIYACIHTHIHPGGHTYTYIPPNHTANPPTQLAYISGAGAYGADILCHVTVVTRRWDRWIGVVSWGAGINRAAMWGVDVFGHAISVPTSGMYWVPIYEGRHVECPSIAWVYLGICCPISGVMRSGDWRLGSRRPGLGSVGLGSGGPELRIWHLGARILRGIRGSPLNKEPRSGERNAGLSGGACWLGRGRPVSVQTWSPKGRGWGWVLAVALSLPYTPTTWSKNLHAYNQTNKHTYIQAGIHAYSHPQSQICREPERQRYRETERHMGQIYRAT